jgi:hypothetical protein
MESIIASNEDSVDEFMDDEFMNDEFMDNEFMDDEFMDDEFMDNEFMDDEFMDDEFMDDEFMDDEFMNDEFMDDFISLLQIGQGVCLFFLSCVKHPSHVQRCAQGINIIELISLRQITHSHVS